MYTNRNPLFEDPFRVEFRFTQAYLKYKDEHPAIREAACLKAMFPDALSPIEPDDLIAGRFIATPGVDKVRYQWDARIHNIPSLGFLPLTPGTSPSGGYFFHDDVLQKKIKDLQPDTITVLKLQELKKFWKTETIAAKVRGAYPKWLSDALPHDEIDGRDVANPAHHLIRITGPHFDWDKLVQRGIPGLRNEIEQYKKIHLSKGNDSIMFQAMEAVLDLVCDVCEHYKKEAEKFFIQSNDERIKQNMKELVNVLENIQFKKPQNLHEAIQLVMLYGVLSGAYSWGRMDEYLADFYIKDVESGLITVDKALNLLKNFWVLINDNGAPYDNRIIIGGRGRRNEEFADRFSLLAIKASKELKLPLPQLSLRFYKGQDTKLYDAGLEAISEGGTFPMLYCDEVNIPSVMNAMNVSEKLAEQYLPYGCGEYVIYKNSLATPSGVFNHTKVLECTLRNGKEKITNRTVGLPMGTLTDFKTFDELLNAFLKNMEYWIETMALQQKIEYEVVARETNYLFWSILYNNCMEKGMPMFSGGVEMLSGTLESYGQINAADSLFAIKKLVYDDKKITAGKLLTALDANFEGYDDVRKMCLDIPKYGNDHKEVDKLQVLIHEHCCLHTRAQAVKNNMHSYLIVIINNLANTVLGRHTLASADGRKDFETMANANNPSPGNDKEGVTAFFNSLVKLRTDIHAGATQNVKFSSDIFMNHSAKLKALLEVYFQKGAQLMVNVVNRNDLADAMNHPENYANLMVRVGGFSARFIELDRDVQEEILHRTLN